MLSEGEIEAIAQRTAALLAERLAGNLAPSPRLVGVDEVADALGCSRSFVHRHAAELGGRKLGSGVRAPWRFDISEAAARLASKRPEEPPPAPQRRSRRYSSQRTASGAPLLPVRGEAAR